MYSRILVLAGEKIKPLPRGCAQVQQHRNPHHHTGVTLSAGTMLAGGVALFVPLQFTNYALK